MADYFDFHFHPLFKQFLVSFEDEGRQNDQCTEPVRLPGLGQVIDVLAGRILASQASISQAHQGGVKVGVACLIAIEYVLSSEQGKLMLLNSRKVTPLDQKFFEFVRTSKGSYNDLVEMELRFYEWVAQAKPQVLQLLSRKVKGQLHPDKLNLILALEGGHNLSKQRINEFAGPTDPVATVQAYRDHPTRDFLYLTLTHFSHIREQPLCSHAYAFKLVRQLPETRPQLAGLLQLGKSVIRACLDVSQNPYPIFIDVKHMSLQARREYYAFRRELLNSRNGFKAPSGGIPILATHVGVTGFPLAELPERLTDFGRENALVPCVRMRTRRQVAGDLNEQESVWFNSWTLNLLDDDIQEIARSGGLIGISLDARILGFEGSAKRLLNKLEQYAPDYMSPADFATLLPELARKLPSLPLPEEEALPKPEVELGLELFGTRRRERELFLFCLNVLHTVAVINALPAAQGKQLYGWDFVCVGSDFDGLVDSLKACSRASDLPAFENELREYFPRAEKAYQLARNNSTSLLTSPGTPFNAQAFQKGPLRKLLYGNGSTFLSKVWQ